ncbi:MAG: hypothetical protein JWQ07_5084 [Ramlibacter sp.]|nr:hypothetical protein [Ramlibacter sp.]
MPAFRALNVSGGVASKSWRDTFYLFCKRWHEHKSKQKEPRVELSRPSPQRGKRPEELSESEWDGIVSLYAKSGRWARDAGPDPQHVGACKAPRHTLEKYGISADTGDARPSRWPTLACLSVAPRGN